jgi:hypothetical protein
MSHDPFNKTADLPCGCRVTLPAGDLERGVLKPCGKHAKYDPVFQLKLILVVSAQIKEHELIESLRNNGSRLHPQASPAVSSGDRAGETV